MALHPKYADTVNQAAQWSAGIGIPGSVFPPLDMAAMSIVWFRMTRKIAKISGHEISWAFAAKLIYAISAGSLLYVGGSKLINALLHSIPGAGTATAAGANAIFNYVYTNRLGNMLVTQFSQRELNRVGLLAMAKTIAAAVFIDLTADEIAGAQAEIANKEEYSNPAYTTGEDSDIAPEAGQSQSSGTHKDLKFGAGTCYKCGGRGYSTWPSSGTVEKCWYCSGSGVAH